MQVRDVSSPAIVLAAVQLHRKRLLIAAVALLCVCLAFVGSRWPDGEIVHESIEWVGIALIVVCILGRTWCSYYISGRKDVALVTFGPYSLCRNPLYFFTLIGVAGIGAQAGSVTFALLSGALAWFVFDLVVREEEKTLELVYGSHYRDYRARVHRFIPQLSQWRGMHVEGVRFDRVARTFIDACVFLIAIPIAESMEYFQHAGLIPVLFRVP